MSWSHSEVVNQGVKFIVYNRKNCNIQEDKNIVKHLQKCFTLNTLLRHHSPLTIVTSDVASKNT